MRTLCLPELGQASPDPRVVSRYTICGVPLLQFPHLLNHIFRAGVETNNIPECVYRGRIMEVNMREVCGYRCVFPFLVEQYIFLMMFICGALLSNLMGRAVLHPYCCCAIRFLCRYSNSPSICLVSSRQCPSDDKNSPFFNFVDT